MSSLSKKLLENGPGSIVTSVTEVQHVKFETIDDICDNSDDVTAIIDISIMCDSDSKPIRREDTESSIIVAMPYMYFCGQSVTLQISMQSHGQIIASKTSHINNKIGREMMRVFKVNSCIVLVNKQIVVANLHCVKIVDGYNRVNDLLTHARRMMRRTDQYVDQMETSAMKMIMVGVMVPDVASDQKSINSAILDLLRSQSPLNLEQVAERLEMVRNTNTYEVNGEYGFFKVLAGHTYKFQGFTTIKAAALASDIFEYETHTHIGLPNFNIRIGLVGSTRHRLLVMITHEKLLNAVNHFNNMIAQMVSPIIHPDFLI